MITFHASAWRQLWGILTGSYTRELEIEIDVLQGKLDNRQMVLFEEITRLSALIDQEYDRNKQADMCIALQALQWARNPYGCAKPSDCYSSEAARLAVTPARPRPDLRVVK